MLKVGLAENLVHTRFGPTALPRAGAQILPSLSELAAQRGLTLKELHLESGRLDEVIRTITA